MDEFLVWCAGFFDGEGSVSIPLGRRGPGTTATDQQYWLQINIVQIERHILEEIRERFGGRITRTNSADEKKRTGADGYVRRECWRWVADSDVAASFLKAVRPHLRLKSKVADAAIAFQNTMHRSFPTVRDVACLSMKTVNQVCQHTTGKRHDPDVARAIAELGYVGLRQRTDTLLGERAVIKQQIAQLNASRGVS